MELGRILIVIGGALLLLGLLLVILPKGFNPLVWFGKLPGDLSYSKDGILVFVPITSMLLVSILLSLVAWILRK